MAANEKQCEEHKQIDLIGKEKKTISNQLCKELKMRTQHNRVCSVTTLYNQKIV